MRYHEVSAGLQIPTYVEEQDLLARADEQDVPKDSLNDREQELARLMVSRGVMRYFKKHDRVFFRTISVNDFCGDCNG